MSRASQDWACQGRPLVCRVLTAGHRAELRRAGGRCEGGLFTDAELTSQEPNREIRPMYDILVPILTFLPV